MPTIAANDAKETIAELVRQSEAGQDAVIMNRGEPLARLVPERPERSEHDIEEAREAFRRLRQMARNVPEPKITTDEILEWIREGRKG